MSAAGIVDARRHGGASVACDVCVIGSGAAGVSAALRLQERGLTVCVLEAGGTEADGATTALGDVECADLPIGPESRNRWFGGSTNTWWGKVAPLDPIDLSVRPWLPLSGWPLGAAELARYCTEACALMGLPDVAAMDATIEPAGVLLDGGRLRTKPFYWARRAVNFADVYRRAARPGRSTVYLHAVVTRIDLDAAHVAVERVHAATLDGARLEVRPRAVVLACGGIENPRLLLASSEQRPAGLGNDHDQVGRYFMEHPKGPGGAVRVTAEAAALAPPYWFGRPRAGVRVRYGVSLAEPWQERLEALNCYVLLDPAFTSAGVLALRRVRAGKLRGVAALRALAGAGRDAGELVALARVRVTNRGRLPGVRIQNFVEQPPLASNRVELGTERDALGVPRARLRWSVSEEERRSLAALHHALADELAGRGIGTLDSPLLAGDGAAPWQPTRDASHHMGTTRMGVDPRTSVVDADTRVHGVANLYVAGSSVFPTGGCANPTLTIVALALRTADAVARSLRPMTLRRPH